MKKNIKNLFEIEPEELAESESEQIPPPPPLPEIDELSPEDLGALLFTEDEVSIIMNTDVTDFSTAVLKGQLVAQAKMRQTVLLQANAGSGEAQKLVEKWTLRIRLEKLR